MRYKISIVSCFVFLMMTTLGAFAQVKARKSSIVALFNGKDFSGWYSFLKDRGKNNDPLGVFSIQNGLIRISGEEYGAIVTEEEYSDYQLIVDFKWGDKTFEPRKNNARDGGVLLHSVGKDGAFGGSWMYSLECQIIEGGTGDFIVVGDRSDSISLTSKIKDTGSTGALVYHPDGKSKRITAGRIDWYGRDEGWRDDLGFRGRSDVENAIGEWNTLKCIVIGDKISVYLNGVLVNEAFNVNPSRGRIQIQSEGAEMFVRKIELSALRAADIISVHAKDGTGIGPKIELMPEWEAFGFFSVGAHIEWEEIEVPESGVYDVYMEWSVSDSDSGKPYVFKIGNHKLKGIIQKSGGWEEFKTIKIGSMKLKKGIYSGSFSPDKKSPAGGMMDFREIKLIPQ